MRHADTRRNGRAIGSCGLSQESISDTAAKDRQIEVRAQPRACAQCPACKAEREQSKRVVEERLRKDREEKDRLIRNMEEWLEDACGD